MPPANRPVKASLPLLTKLEIKARVSSFKQKPSGTAEQWGGSELFQEGRNRTLPLLLRDSHICVTDKLVIGSNRQIKIRTQAWSSPHPEAGFFIQPAFQ